MTEVRSGAIEERTPGDGEGGETNQEMVLGILNSIVDSVVQGKECQTLYLCDLATLFNHLLFNTPCSVRL